MRRTAGYFPPWRNTRSYPPTTPILAQYAIVPADNADPGAVVALREDERLVMAGTVHSRASPDEVKTLYVKEETANVNKSTGLSTAGEKACRAIITDLMAILPKDQKIYYSCNKQ